MAEPPEMDPTGPAATAAATLGLRGPRHRRVRQRYAGAPVRAGAHVPLVEDDGDTLVVKHLYIERLMMPLNLYLDQANEKQARAAVRDYGDAIKELASVNIFPGDMLFKNFGVTRGGRIVFYDYDEIAYMTEINFRRIPPPRTPEDEMAAEPWYPVAANDVFPEEFGPFLLSGAKVRGPFLECHSDLLTPDYWNEVKAKVAAGQLGDVFPYPDSARFARRFGGGAP